MTVDVTRSVGELAAEIPSAIRVFEKWNIDYCCKGSLSLSVACESAGIPVVDVVAALSGAEKEQPEPAGRDWTSATATDLIEHIVSSHHQYTSSEVETLEVLMKKVLAVHGTNHPELRTLAPLVGSLKADLIPHMLKEEQVLFPFVRSLEEALEASAPPPTPFFGTVQNPIRMMMMEHDAAGETLKKIREVTGDFTLPDDACFSYAQLYRRLGDLEADLHQHIHLENNILFPRVVSMESGRAPEFAFDGNCCGQREKADNLG